MTPPFISIKTLSGIVAMWAVRQSPYPCPENLYHVVQTFAAEAEHYALPEFPSDWPCLSCTREDLAIVLDHCLFSQPFVQQWNERKNRRDGPGIILRYGGPKYPDDDFIDLDALRQNIICDTIQWEQRESESIKSSMARTKPKIPRQIRKILHG